MAEAVTMWDFSWLLRRTGSENEYADVDRVLDELAERGYEVVRIDAFPHWIAPDERGEVVEEITAGPQPPGFMWGNHHDVVVRPRDELLRFLRGLADRGMQAGLSTWFTPDAERRNARVRTPEDLSRVWDATLSFVENAGLSETVRYVDLCNEWPGWSPGVNDHIFGGRNPTDRAWTTAEVRRVDAYQESLEQLRARHPGYPLTLSWFPRTVGAGAAEDLMRLSTDGQDLAEVHLWLSLVCPRFIDQTRYHDNYSTDATNLNEHEHLVREHLATSLPSWMTELSAVMTAWATWARRNGLPLWTTEGWASIGWSPDLVPGWDGWDYVKQVGEAAVGLALQHGWQGVCTSNFSQPHHRGLWADIGWHRRLTRQISAG